MGASLSRNLQSRSSYVPRGWGPRDLPSRPHGVSSQPCPRSSLGCDCGSLPWARACVAAGWRTTRLSTHLRLSLCLSPHQPRSARRLSPPLSLSLNSLSLATRGWSRAYVTPLSLSLLKKRRAAFEQAPIRRASRLCSTRASGSSLRSAATDHPPAHHAAACACSRPARAPPPSRRSPPPLRPPAREAD